MFPNDHFVIIKVIFLLKGVKIKTELASLVKDLPSELSKFAESAKSLNDAVQYYDKFTKFVTNK